jgi:hypothetical protein
MIRHCVGIFESLRDPGGLLFDVLCHDRIRIATSPGASARMSSRRNTVARQKPRIPHRGINSISCERLSTIFANELQQGYGALI